MTRNLSLFAGRDALARIRADGLSPASVQVVAGAAGGPKWLVLYHLDRFILPTWMQGRQAPLFLVGSSIGAWRFAALSCDDPGALDRFLDAYTQQRYHGRPTAQEVSRESARILDRFLQDSQVEAILAHPFLRLNILAVRSKWPASSESPPLLGLGLACASIGNLFSRKALGLFFERALFFHPGRRPPFFETGGFPVQTIPLAKTNLKRALLASGSIPLVMEGVREIPGARSGMYRDGGLIDYHMDIPYQGNEDGGLVLYPHYTDRIIPGWLDKRLTWRKPRCENMRNVLLVCPSKEFVETLPNGKIPDRNDFRTFQGRDRERFAYWKTVVETSRILAEEFHEVVQSGRIRHLVQPLPCRAG